MLVRLLLTLRCVAATLLQSPTIARLGFLGSEGLGFGLLPASGVPKHIVEDARAAVADRLCELLDAALDSGCDVVEQQYSFAEICHRKRLRWDLRMPERSTAWAALLAQVEEQALPQLAALVPGGGVTPRILMSGAVVSRPGASHQSFHVDGTGRLVNVFVPLVDVAPESDGTQFWPGSHLDPAAPDAAPELGGNAAAMAAMVSPGCPAGGFLCFDYRCVHRGLANARRERAVAYFVVALEPDVEDRHNFPHLSVRASRQLPIYQLPLPSSPGLAPALASPHPRPRPSPGLLSLRRCTTRQLRSPRRCLSGMTR